MMWFPATSTIYVLSTASIGSSPGPTPLRVKFTKVNIWRKAKYQNARVNHIQIHLSENNQILCLLKSFDKNWIVKTLIPLLNKIIKINVYWHHFIILILLWWFYFKLVLTINYSPPLSPLNSLSPPYSVIIVGCWGW